MGGLNNRRAALFDRGQGKRCKKIVLGQG